MYTGVFELLVSLTCVGTMIGVLLAYGMFFNLFADFSL